VLPAVALGGAVVGAICAVGLTTHAGARVGSPHALRLLFAVWVCSPFAALLTGRAMSESWRPSMRAALHTVTLLIGAGSSLAYVYFALGATRPATAAFVLTAPASWLFAAVALGTTALFLRK
jgi:phosphate/sulfate permease